MVLDAYPFFLPTFTMFSTLLAKSGLRQIDVDGPPELPYANFMLRDLCLFRTITSVAAFRYFSPDTTKFPHRLFLLNQFLDSHSPRLTLDDRISLRVACTLSESVDDMIPTYLLLEGWIVGVHFEVDQYIEYTLLAIFQGILQVIFLEVPQRFVEQNVLYPNTMYVKNTWYWTYLPSPAIEARAKFIQNVDEDLVKWSSRSPAVHALLFLLRSTPVADFMAIDLRSFSLVSFSS